MIDANTIFLGCAWYLVFIFSTCLHEAGHAFAAWKLGDPTAYHGGQVTLNPIPHIRREPIGMIVVPIITLIANGWMIGWASAPYDPRWAENYPRRGALMALAGPVGNLLLVIVSALLLRVGLHGGLFDTGSSLVVARNGGTAEGLAMILSIFFTLNLLLFVFNLLPLPPLDGSGVVPLFLSSDSARRYLTFIRQPGFWAIGLIAALYLFPRIFGPIFRFCQNLLFAGY